MKQLKGRMEEARDEFYRNRRDRGFMAFWWSDPLHYVLGLEVAIADVSGKSINFEAIVKLLPSSMGSRSTIATVLDDFVTRGYMCKAIGKDKRRRDYVMRPEAMQLMNAWFTKRDFSIKAVS